MGNGNNIALHHCGEDAFKLNFSNFSCHGKFVQCLGLSYFSGAHNLCHSMIQYTVVRICPYRRY